MRARVLFAAAALGLAGCRQDMHDQPRYEAFERSETFADRRSARLPIAGTVARGQLHEDELLETGRVCFGLVTDASHQPRFDTGFGWPWLRVPERPAEAVLAGLAAGSFYGSCGPLLHDVAVDGEDVEVIVMTLPTPSCARVRASAPWYSAG